MKRLIIALTLFCFGFFFSQTKTVEAKVIGYGNKKNAIESAEKTAINQLLFRGIPNTDQPDPIIGTNEEEIIKNNKKYFESFLKERYKSFIVSSKAGEVTKENGKKGAEVTVTINVKALRLDLETNQIIRKFGY